MSMFYIYCNEKPTKETFSFTFSAVPGVKFCFDRPASVSSPTNRPFKRRRALSDVDGDGNEGRKKRRLRLYLITSRLSRPFSQPASNIANRGVSKIALWGKGRATSRNPLRKAAIMNSVRMRLSAAKELMLQRQEDRNRETLELKEIVVQPSWRCHERLPPSPLGTSNYDALDLEDAMMNDELEDGISRCSSIYSDFNIMDPTSPEGDSYDYLDTLDGITPEDLPDMPPTTPEEGIVDILREEERQGDGLFVHLKV